MKRTEKRILSAVCAAVMTLGLASCGKKNIESSDVTVTFTTTTTTAATTAAPAPEPEQTETTTTKKKEKAPEKIENYNQLTGLYDVADEGKGKRPCAVMINNIAAALPQYGIYSADIIFEVVAEGGITRLMALYADESDIPNVCSIRSARYYYVLLSQSFDAVFLHWGDDPIICRSMFDELGIDHINGMSNGNIFGRDYDRMSYMDIEHTGFLNGSLVMNEISNYGFRSELKEGYDSIFKFYDEFTKPAGDKCTKATVTFSDWYYSTFNYSDKTKTYKKLHNGNKHMDQSANKQLEFTNLLVLEVPEIKVLYPDYSKIVGFDFKEGSGYLITAGVKKNIINYSS